MEKLGKSWKIFIITAVVLIGNIYGYYKINNRNAFEEMYNSYYNLLPLGAIDNMPQIKYVRRADLGDEKKQTRELLEKHNISKEWLQKKSDELLDTVLTDWQRYSGSSYSRSNMGRLTIEKDEFLG